MSLQVQFLTLGMMMLSGIAMGMIYDSYRVLAGQLRVSRWLIPVLDLLYWAGVTLLVFRVLMYSNEGQLRLFVFIGLWLGVTLHFMFFSKISVRTVLGVIAVVKWTTRLIQRIVYIMIYKPIIGLWTLLCYILMLLHRLAIFLFKVVLQLLYPVRWLAGCMYTLLRKLVPASWVRWGARLKLQLLSRFRK